MATNIVAKAQSYFEKGNAHLANKDYEEAIVAYERAIELIPSFGAASYNLDIAKQRVSHDYLVQKSYSGRHDIQNALKLLMAEYYVRSGTWPQSNHALINGRCPTGIISQVIELSFNQMESDGIVVKFSYVDPVSNSIQSNSFVMRSKRGGESKPSP